MTGTRWPFVMKPTSGSERLSFFSAIGTFRSWITRASQLAMTGVSASTSARRRCTARSAIALLLGSVGELNELREFEQPGKPLAGLAGLFIRLLLLGLRRALHRRRRPLAGVLPGLAEPVALALDGDHVGVMDDPIDEGRGARRVGEDRRPVDKSEIGGPPSRTGDRASGRCRC